MEISNDIQQMTPVDTESLGFLAIFEDGSQIDASGDVDDMGVTIGAGRLDDEGEWSEIRISWQALQAVADELNEMLRQARKVDWL